MTGLVKQSGSNMTGALKITLPPNPGTQRALAISGNHYLEFNTGDENKQNDAGKIGYQVFTGDALDIIGAGPKTPNPQADAGPRKIKLWAEGGLTVTGPIRVDGPIYQKLHLIPWNSYGGDWYNEESPVMQHFKSALKDSPKGTFLHALVDLADLNHVLFFGWVDNGDQIRVMEFQREREPRIKK